MFLTNVNHLMQVSGHRMSTAIDLHLVVTLAVILLSSNTYVTYVTLALLGKALSRSAVCNLRTKLKKFL